MAVTEEIERSPDCVHRNLQLNMVTACPRKDTRVRNTVSKAKKERKSNGSS